MTVDGWWFLTVIKESPDNFAQLWWVRYREVQSSATERVLFIPLGTSEDFLFRALGFFSLSPPPGSWLCSSPIVVTSPYCTLFAWPGHLSLGKYCPKQQTTGSWRTAKSMLEPLSTGWKQGSAIPFPTDGPCRPCPANDPAVWQKPSRATCTSLIQTVAEALGPGRQGSWNFSMQANKIQWEHSIVMAEFFILELYFSCCSYEEHKMKCWFKMQAQSRCTVGGSWWLTWESASPQLAQPSPAAGHQLSACHRHEDSTDLLFH